VVKINWKFLGLGVFAGLLKLGQVVIEHQDEVREGRLHDYDRTGPHPLENKVPVNRGGYAFATRHVWVCECGSRGQGSMSMYDADRLARAHVLKNDVRESHKWHIEQEYPPEQGWFRSDGSQW
jgi:hypothetical protein